jgi:hypothetical protein
MQSDFIPEKLGVMASKARAAQANDKRGVHLDMLFVEAQCVANDHCITDLSGAISSMYHWVLGSPFC